MAMISTLSCLSALGFRSCELPDVYNLVRPYAELSAIYGLSIPGGNRLSIAGWVRSGTKVRSVNRFIPIAYSSFDECIAEVAERTVGDKVFLEAILSANDEDLFLHCMRFGVGIYQDVLLKRDGRRRIDESVLSDDERRSLLTWRS